MEFQSLKPGYSVLNKEINAFLYEKDPKKKYLYLMAGCHGDEPEGVYVLKELFTWLKVQNDFNYNILILPTLNVDGLEKNSRTNENGVDLNRNYPSKGWTEEFSEPKYFPGTHPLSEPENQFLASLLEQYHPSLIISFHSYKPMLNFNGNCKEIAEEMAKFNKYPVVGEFEYPTPGSFGEWVPERFEAPVLTYECPVLNSGISLEEIWEENRDGLLHFLTNSYSD